LGYFERALDIDPDYALAYLGISLLWGSYAQHGFMSSNEAKAESDKAIKKAMELDSSLVEIRSWLAATYAWGTWEWERAGKEFRRAIEINPNYAFVRASYSLYLALMGNPEEGLLHGELAIKLDPFNTLYRSIHGQALKNARKYDEALDVLLKLYDTEPDQGIGLPALLAVYHELGKYDEALEIAKRIYTLKGIDAAIETLEAGNKEGGYNMAWRRTAEMMIDYSDTTYFPPWQICTIYCRAGMKEEALDWLEKAYDERDNNMPIISVDPLFDFLREDVRFKNILRKMNLTV
jgi:adenylate cyclase